MAYKQSQYIVTYFLCKHFVLPKQFQFKHAAPERYKINLLNNIRNFDCLVAIQAHQDYFLLRLRWIIMYVYLR